MDKFNIILHTTTHCNYNCSYCDVIKDKKNLGEKQLNELISFIEKNFKFIDGFKFFGGEPLLAFGDIKSIIDSTQGLIGDTFEIVTNTTLLNNEIGEYFRKYFARIFFSIDTENPFDYKKVYDFIDAYDLGDKVYFNLIISPGKEKMGFEQFERLYNSGMKNYNILPVYLTKLWTKTHLLALSEVMKTILDITLVDNSLKLYGFQQNEGYNSSLINKSIFIDTDGKMYYSDIVATYLGSAIKKDLHIGNVSDFKMEGLIGDDFSDKKEIIRKLEDSLYNKIKGQRKLHKIMDYFSQYLNNRKGGIIIKD